MTAANEMTDQWVQEMYPAVHRAAWAITGDASAADDLAQQTFIVALERWDTFDGRSKRSTWVHGILVRLSRKHFRTLARLRRRMEKWVGQRQPHDTEREASDGLAESQWRESIWSEVAKLPRPQAEAITLRFGSELSYEEIAATTQCAVGTAKSRVHQGLKRLQKSKALHDALELTPIDQTNNEP